MIIFLVLGLISVVGLGIVFLGLITKTNNHDVEIESLKKRLNRIDTPPE